MQLSESSIYISLKQLRQTLYKCQFSMQKANRIIYGTPLMEASSHTLRYYTLAFTVKEKKIEYLDEAIGWFAVLRNDIQFCIENNIIQLPNPKGLEVNGLKLELFKIIAKIDDELCKWRAYLAKGKSIVA